MKFYLSPSVLKSLAKCFLIFTVVNVYSPLGLSFTEKIISINNYDLYPNRIELGDSTVIQLPSLKPIIRHNDLQLKTYDSFISIDRINRVYPKGNNRFGKGWHFSELLKLSIVNDRRIVLDTGYGGIAYYAKENGQFISFDSSVITNVDNNFQLLRPNSEKLFFNQSGQLLSRSDRNDNSISYHYKDNQLVQIKDDRSGRFINLKYKNNLITEISDNAERRISYSYNKSDQLISVEQFGKTQTNYYYDNFGHLTLIEQDNRTPIELSYSVDGSVKTVTDRFANKLTFDSQNREGQATILLEDNHSNKMKFAYRLIDQNLKVRVTDNNDLHAEYVYNIQGQLISSKNPSGLQVTNEYDDLGRLTKQNDNRGTESIIEYKDKTHYIKRINDNRGFARDYIYDSKKNLVKLQANGAGVIEYQRSESGKTTNTIVNEQTVYQFDWDKSGDRSLLKYDSLINQRVAEYDELGRPVLEDSDIRGHSEMTYDDNDRLLSVSNTGSTLEFVYNLAGDIVSVIDSSGAEISYKVNDAGEAISASMPNGETYHYKNNNNKSDNRSKIFKFPEGGKLKFGVNDSGQTNTKTDPLNNTTRYKYDSAGRITRLIWPDKESINYSYDKTGQLDRINYSDGLKESFSYDLGRLVGVESPNSQLVYEYDNSTGALKKVENLELNLTATNKYNDTGRLASVSLTGAGSISYKYNKQGQLTGLTDPDGRMYVYNYDEHGLLKTITYPNNIVQEHSYFPVSVKLNTIRISNGNNVLFERSYQYNNAGFITTEDDSVALNTRKYNYNDNGAIVSAKLSGQINSTYEYNYDQNSNLELENVDGKTVEYEYSLDNNIVRKGNTVYKHDTRGNLKKVKSNAGERIFDYSAANRLISLTLEDGNQKRFKYDTMGRLVHTELNGEVTKILWNGDHRLAETDQRGRIKRLYIYADGVDNLLAVMEHDNVYFIHQDTRKSSILITNEQGEVVEQPNFDPFGKPLKQSTTNLLHFAGHPYDSDLKAYHMRARFYYPEQRRFGARDPVAGSMAVPVTMNPYLYVFNNPINAIDPSGRQLLLAAAFGLSTGAAIIYTVGRALFVDSRGGISSTRYNSMDDSYEPVDVAGNTEVIEPALRQVQSLANNAGAAGTPTTAITVGSTAINTGVQVLSGGGAPLVSINPADLVNNSDFVNTMSDPNLAGGQATDQALAQFTTTTIEQLGTAIVVSGVNALAHTNPGSSLTGSAATAAEIAAEEAAAVEVTAESAAAAAEQAAAEQAAAEAAAQAAAEQAAAEAATQTAAEQAAAKAATQAAAEQAAAEAAAQVAAEQAATEAAAQTAAEQAAAEAAAQAAAEQAAAEAAAQVAAEQAAAEAAAQAAANTGSGGGSGYNPLNDPAFSGNSNSGNSPSARDIGNSLLDQLLDSFADSGPAQQSTQNSGGQSGDPVDPYYTDPDGVGYPDPSDPDPESLVTIDDLERNPDDIAGEFGTPELKPRPKPEPKAQPKPEPKGQPKPEAPPPPVTQTVDCNNVARQGRNTPESVAVNLTAAEGKIDFSYSMRSVRDRMVVTQGGGKLFDTGCVSGSSTRSLALNGRGNSVVVQVFPNCAGSSSTIWSFSVSCP